MDFKLIYFTDDKGSCPVDEYIQSMPDQQKAKIYAYLDELREKGFALKRPWADSLGGKTGLYELRPGRHRILYFFHDRKYIVLLHALLKKTDEIPKGDIKAALDRKDTCEVLFKYGIIVLEEWKSY